MYKLVQGVGWLTTSCRLLAGFASTSRSVMRQATLLVTGIEKSIGTVLWKHFVLKIKGRNDGYERKRLEAIPKIILHTNVS
jgi:hypothetical protein